MMARADRLISQTSRLLVEVDRLMSRAAPSPAEAIPGSGQMEAELRADIEYAPPSPPPIPIMHDARSDRPIDILEKRSPSAPGESMPRPRGLEPRTLDEYHEMGWRLDRQLARADHLIAQTSRLLEQADLVIGQADQPAGDQPVPPGEKKPEGDTKPGGSSSDQPAPPAKAQPAPEAASKDKPTPAGATKDQPGSGAPPQQEEEREVARVPLAAVQAGGLLLPKDSMIVEPTIFYTYSQNTRLIVTGFSVLPLIILGTFESERITSNLVSPAIQLRYGLFRGLQLDFRLPYTYANQSRLRLSTETAGQVEESQHDGGIGDISFGVTYQFLYERGWLPDLMLRVGALAPTGQSQFDIFRKIAGGGGLSSAEAFLNALNTQGIALGAGRWNYQVTVNAVKALDPGILFATVGWFYTPASTEDLIQVTSTPVSGGVVLQPLLVSSDLGAVNSLQASLGLAIALNNQLSMNLSISELISAATKANGIKVPGSATNIGQLNFGITLSVSPTTTINFVSSIGVTPDSPNITTLLSVPVFYSNVAENTYGYLKSAFANLFRKKPAPVEKPVEKPKEGSTG